jgi:hypothetical protein
VKRVLAIEAAVLLKLKLTLNIAPIFTGSIVSAITLAAF